MLPVPHVRGLWELAGGGIGDEIVDPAGDPYELYRILFDITFFFFVIVILLAIIQGTAYMPDQTLYKPHWS